MFTGKLIPFDMERFNNMLPSYNHQAHACLLVRYVPLVLKD